MNTLLFHQNPTIPALHDKEHCLTGWSRTRAGEPTERNMELRPTGKDMTASELMDV